jgi:hypothetical protein
VIPIEQRVDETFRAINPDFPIPDKITRPKQLRHASKTLRKLSSNDFSSIASAVDSR